MRTSFGGTWLIQLMILFILLFAGYIILTIEYSKNVKVKNEMISIVEKYDGLNEQSVALLNNYISSVGYQVKGKCESGDGVYGLSELQNDELEEVESGSKYYYCIKKYKGANTSYYYQVTVFYRFNLPVLGDISNFTIKGTTTNFQSQDEDKYCMTISGPCRETNVNRPQGGNQHPEETIYYNVSFDLNGGTGSIPTQKVRKGRRADQPSNPTREGYTFEGWTLNGSSFDFYTYITSDINLVAKWKLKNIRYKVVYNLNGGKWGHGWSIINDDCESGNIERFDGYWESTVKSGYTLDYFTDSDGNKYYKSNARFTCSKDITLTAVWREN